MIPLLLIAAVLILISYVISRREPSRYNQRKDAVAAKEEKKTYIKTRIAGIHLLNPDGTSRQQIVQSCRIGEKLAISGPEDSKFRVCRTTGELLGYLPGDTADKLAPHWFNGSYLEAEIVDYDEWDSKSGNMKGWIVGLSIKDKNPFHYGQPKH